MHRYTLGDTGPAGDLPAGRAGVALLGEGVAGRLQDGRAESPGSGAGAVAPRAVPGRSRRLLHEVTVLLAIEAPDGYWTP